MTVHASHFLLYTVFQKSRNCFWRRPNFVKFLPTLVIFGKMMAKTIILCKVYLFTTSPNLCQRTTVWNTDAPNQIVTLRGDYLYHGSPMH